VGKIAVLQQRGLLLGPGVEISFVDAHHPASGTVDLSDMTYLELIIAQQFIPYRVNPHDPS
jgi:hypothetical protein